MNQIARSAELIRSRTTAEPRVLLVLGSGLGDIVSEVEGPVTIPYSEIPGFPRSTVAGHAGRLVLGTIEEVPVAVMQGRFHLYEGWTAEEVARPVRVMSELGATVLITTNAAGGVRRSLRTGNLMLISDHINMTGTNPLAGPQSEGEERFPDMTEAYDARLREAARGAARNARIPLVEGIYLAILGPSYETPAEIGMIDRTGADAVGMSTVPEVIAARARGMRVLGISCITNPAAGISPEPLVHDEVVAEAARAHAPLVTILRGTLSHLRGAADDA